MFRLVELVVLLVVEISDGTTLMSLDYVNIDTTGNAIDFGDLTTFWQD